jgi:hypothetical protein
MQMHIGQMSKPKGTMKSPAQMREMSEALNKSIRKHAMDNHWGSQPTTFPETTRNQRKD